VGSDFPNFTDQELARQTQAGSLVAFEELVYRYEGRIYGFVANSCGNCADAREVTQDTFVRAFQAIEQFDSQRSFAPWLFTIARRKCLDHYRAARPPADEPVPELADHDDPAELLARQEDRQSLWELARRHLPKPQFQALWLKYAEEMNVADIAQVLRKTQTHVKVLLFRARQALGRELKAAQGSGVPRGGAASRAAPNRETTPTLLTGEGRGGRVGCVIGCSGALVSSGPSGARKGPL
jgi:RNA polymerase sigma-70 factor (ECF subfamily)